MTDTNADDTDESNDTSNTGSTWVEYTCETPLRETDEVTFEVSRELTDQEEENLRRASSQLDAEPVEWWHGIIEDAPSDDKVEVASHVISLLAQLSTFDEDDAAELFEVSPLASELSDDEFVDAVGDGAEKAKHSKAKQQMDIAVTERNGQYVKFKTGKDGEKYQVRVANFTLDVEQLLWVDDDELHVEMTVKPSSIMDKEQTVTVPYSVFDNVAKFRDEVCVGRTTRFDGSQVDLNDVREIVGHQLAPEMQGTHQAGVFPEEGEVVTPSGVLTEDGWVDDSQHAFVSRDLSEEDKIALGPESHPVDVDTDEVAETIELATQMRDMERWLPVLGWFYSAPFCPWVREKEGAYNILNVWAETGAGKTFSIKPLWRMLGMGDGNGPLKVKGTAYTMMAGMSLTDSMPMWWDEFKPADMDAKERQDVNDLLRNVSAGATDSRGDSDMSTNAYHVEAPVVISGEQSITGPAESRRLVRTMLRKDTKEKPVHLSAYKELVGSTYRTEDGEFMTPSGCDLNQHAVAYWQFVLEKYDTGGIEDMWMNSKEEVYNLLAEEVPEALEDLDELQIQGLQTVVFGLKMQAMFAGQMGADTAALPDATDIKGSLLYLVGHAEDKGGSHLDQFLSLAARAAAHGSLDDGEQYRWVHFDGPKEELRLNIDLAHDALSKYRREYDVDGIDWLGNVNDYKSRIRELADDPDSYVVSVGDSGLGVPTTDINRAVGFDAEVAEEQIDGFERSMFLDGGDGAETDIDALEAADTLSNADHGYSTVTVEVVSTDSPASTSIAQSAIVQDATATLDLVTWYREDESAEKLEEGQCYMMEQVTVEEYSGSTRLAVHPGVTEVTEIDQGDGHTMVDASPAEEAVSTSD